MDGVDDDDNNDNDDVLGNTLPEIVRLLSDTGAAELPDEGGMIPLHYAAAYGTSQQVLEVLLEVYPASLTKTENKGRNPLHLAMVNAHRQLSPVCYEHMTINQSNVADDVTSRRESRCNCCYCAYCDVAMLLLSCCLWCPMVKGNDYGRLGTI